MLIHILDVIVIWMSFIGEGATEGYTWASKERRMDNPIIKGSDVSGGKGKLGYHKLRFAETFGLFYLSQRVFPTLIGLGVFLIGLFIYERVLTKVVNNVYFYKDKSPYRFGKITVKRALWQDWLALTGGLVFIVVGIICLIWDN